jgi:hypothetical protein
MSRLKCRLRGMRSRLERALGLDLDVSFIVDLQFEYTCHWIPAIELTVWKGIPLQARYYHRII